MTKKPEQPVPLSGNNLWYAPESLLQLSALASCKLSQRTRNRPNSGTEFVFLCNSGTTIWVSVKTLTHKRNKTPLKICFLSPPGLGIVQTDIPSHTPVMTTVCILLLCLYRSTEIRVSRLISYLFLVLDSSQNASGNHVATLPQVRKPETKEKKTSDLVVFSWQH